MHHQRPAMREKRCARSFCTRLILVVGDASLRIRGKRDAHALEVELGISTADKLTIVGQLLSRGNWYLRGLGRTRTSGTDGTLETKRGFFDNACGNDRRRLGL